MHPRRGAAEAPCRGFCTVVSLSPKLADDPCCRVFPFQISSRAILKGCCHRMFSEGTRYCNAIDFFRLFVVSSQDSVLFHKFLFSYGQKQLVTNL